MLSCVWTVECVAERRVSKRCCRFVNLMRSCTAESHSLLPATVASPSNEGWANFGADELTKSSTTDAVRPT